MKKTRPGSVNCLSYKRLQQRALLAADLGFAAAVEDVANDSVDHQTRETEAADVKPVAKNARSVSALPAFPTEPGLYQVYSNFGRVGQINLADGTFDTASYNAGTKVNAAGFRIADNYAYGIMTGTYDLVRIGSNGQTENLGSVSGLVETGSYYVGDFADDGLLYVRGSTDLRTLYGINVETGTVENTITASQHLVSIYDIAFNNVDRKFYASVRNAENYLISIDLNGAVERIGNNGLSKLTFGAMYADADGNVFGGSNQTGGVYRFNLQTGEATLVGNGPVSGVNDGFSNASVVLELPPLAADDLFETTGLASTTGNLLDAGDIDGNDDQLQVVAVNGDAVSVGKVIQLDSGSLVAVDADGNYQYKPSSAFQNLTVNQRTSEEFTYTIADPGGLSDTATVKFKVVGVKPASEFEGIRVTGLEAFGGKRVVQLKSAGDLNGDGFVDGMASAYQADNGRGVTAIVYGSSSGFQPGYNINQLRAQNGGDGSAGVLFFGSAANDLSGYSLAKLGDFNGDGIDDIAIGSKDADPNGVRNAGAVHVVFGNRSGFGAEFQLNQLDAAFGGDGSQGVVLEGINRHDLSGGLVTGIGDFNADGINDIAIASKFADVDSTRINAGQTYIVYGSEAGFDANVSLASFTAAGGNDGSKGLVFNGVRKHDLSGSQVSGEGDINGDGIDDIVITSRFGDSFGLMTDVGNSFVVYGTATHSGPEFELSTLLEENGGDNSRGIVIHGSKRFENSGSYVAMTPDLNGDGLAELTIGINDSNTLTNHVLNGGSARLQSAFEIVDLDTQTRVLLDNFDVREEVHEDRDWDRFGYNVTLHSNGGSQVTIWGDPHVIIKMDGLTRRFNIPLGHNTIELKGGATIEWDTAEADIARFPLGPPLTYFNIDTQGVALDQAVDLEDGLNFIDVETGITEGQLRQFARILYQMRS